MPQITIHHIVMIGDSLSPQHVATPQKLFGIFTTSELSVFSLKTGLHHALTWHDHFIAILADTLLLPQAINRQPTLDELNGLPLNHYLRFVYKSMTGRHIALHDQDFARSYSDHGMVAYSYRGDRAESITVFCNPRPLPTITDKRGLLIADDQERGLTASHYASTLVIECSGINELFTERCPDKAAMFGLLKNKCDHLRELVKHGYRHFMLFNMPDVSLTPHYQQLPGTAGERIRQQASSVCTDFNSRFASQVAALGEELRAEYPDITFNIVNAAYIFQFVSTNPEKFGFTPHNSTSSSSAATATNHMFCNNLLPSPQFHAIFGQRFYLQFREHSTFVISSQSLREQFRDLYHKKWREQQHSWWGYYAKQGLTNYFSVSLEDIFRHAAEHSRTFAVLVELGWLNQQRELTSHHPALIAAWQASQVAVAAPAINPTTVTTPTL